MNLTSPQLDKKFPIFYGTQNFITVFTQAHLNQINVVHKFSFITLRFTLILSQPCISQPFKWSLSSRFHHQNLPYISLLPHIIHMPRPSHSPWLYNKNIWGGVRTMKPLVTQVHAASLYFFSGLHLFWSTLISDTLNLLYFINLASQVLL